MSEATQSAIYHEIRKTNQLLAELIQVIRRQHPGSGASTGPR